MVVAGDEPGDRMTRAARAGRGHSSARGPRPCLILLYHDLADERAAGRYSIVPDAFERQLVHLLDAGYEAISLDAAVEAIGDGGGPDRSTFTVTFDDGFGSFSRQGVKILGRLGLLASTALFVPTAHVGTRASWMNGRDLPLLEWDELVSLSEQKISINSHGHRHDDMSKLGYEEALLEASESRSLLERHGLAPRYFSFPFGRCSQAAKQAVKDAGYEAALAVEKGGRDCYEIRRLPVYGGSALFRLKTSGHYFELRDAVATLAGRGVRS